MLCEDCNELVDEETHNCLSNLNEIIQDIESIQKKHSQRIKLLQDSARSLTQWSPIPQNLYFFDDVEHNEYACDGCGRMPIIGLRFKCKKCENFDFCSVCRESRPHQHSDFYILTSSGCHEGVGCDGCGEAPIKSLRYNCKECGNFDFCHKCYITKGHPHDFEVILPLSISVETYCNKPKLSYKTDDEIVIYIVVCNMSTQPLRTLSLRRQSEVPFKYVEETQYFGLNAGEKKTLIIKSVISSNAGYYACIFQFYCEEERETVGPPILLNISVSRRWI
jgi:hypothetical protein